MIKPRHCFLNTFYTLYWQTVAYCKRIFLFAAKSEMEYSESRDIPSTNAEEAEDDPKGEPKINLNIYTCHVCDTSFPRVNHLTRHMTLHRALLIHKCSRCDKAFATPEHLTKHMDQDHIDKPYICAICNKTFVRGEHLIRHLKMHPEEQGDAAEVLKCSICEKIFTR